MEEKDLVVSKFFIKIFFIISLISLASCDNQDCVGSSDFGNSYIAKYKIKANPFDKDGNFIKEEYQRANFECDGEQIDSDGYYHWFDTGIDVKNTGNPVKIKIKGAVSFYTQDLGIQNITSAKINKITFNGNSKFRDVGFIINRPGYEIKSIALLKKSYFDVKEQSDVQEDFVSEDIFVKKQLMTNTHSLENSNKTFADYNNNDADIKERILALLEDDKNKNINSRDIDKIIYEFSGKKILERESILIDQNNKIRKDIDGSINWEDNNRQWYKGGENIKFNYDNQDILLTDTAYFSKNPDPFYLDDDYNQQDLSEDYFSKRNCCVNHNGSSLETIDFLDKIENNSNYIYSSKENICCIKQDEQGNCSVIDYEYDASNPRYSYIVDTKKMQEDENMARYSSRDYGIFDYCTRDVFLS